MAELLIDALRRVIKATLSTYAHQACGPEECDSKYRPFIHDAIYECFECILIFDDSVAFSQTRVQVDDELRRSIALYAIRLGAANGASYCATESSEFAPDLH
jgi:hypothetical protein